MSVKGFRGAYGCPDDGSTKVWAAGTCPGRLPVKIHVSRLLAALATVVGDSFDPPTREAWAIAYNLVAETMLEGAASARPIGT